MTTQHDYPSDQDYLCLCKTPTCRARYFGPKRSVVCYACSQDKELSTQSEIDHLTERLEELDRQAFLNFVETHEIISRLKELGREIPEDEWSKE